MKTYDVYGIFCDDIECARRKVEDVLGVQLMLMTVIIIAAITIVTRVSVKNTSSFRQTMTAESSTGPSRTLRTSPFYSM
jgi:hypothetical protein